MRRKSAGVFAVILACTLVSFIPASADAIPLDVGVWGGGGCCDGLTRGYWFTAPVDFVINQLSVPGPVDSEDATIQVLLLNVLPPDFPSSTNDFASLGYWEGQTTVNTNLAIAAGSIVGILGYNGGWTPYRDANGSYPTTLGGFGITLTRFGFQDAGVAHDVWQELDILPTGIVYMDYSAVPEPGTLLLLGSGLTGLALRRRRKS